MGLPTIGAREIAGQPALAYSRFVNRIRMALTEGIKGICDLELALHGLSPEQWQYRIVWPRIATDPYGKGMSADAEANNSSIEDLD